VRSDILFFERSAHRWTFHQLDITGMYRFSSTHGYHRFLVVIWREERQRSHSARLEDVLLQVFFESEARYSRYQESRPVDTNAIVKSGSGLEEKGERVRINAGIRAKDERDLVLGGPSREDLTVEPVGQS
jgi:hypothetical protein